MYTVELDVEGDEENQLQSGGGERAASSDVVRKEQLRFGGLKSVCLVTRFHSRVYGSPRRTALHIPARPSSSSRTLGGSGRAAFVSDA